jgi:hypothetical protein
MTEIRLHLLLQQRAWNWSGKRDVGAHHSVFFSRLTLCSLQKTIFPMQHARIPLKLTYCSPVPITRMNLMFCWSCIVVYQYSEINVMHFLFSLLRIRGLYMFRALLAHPQEALNLVQPTEITRTQYTECRLCSASWRWASNPRNM